MIRARMFQVLSLILRCICVYETHFGRLYFHIHIKPALAGCIVMYLNIAFSKSRKKSFLTAYSCAILSSLTQGTEVM